jgi:DNA-binding FrmR family transcriptional regulator
LEDHLRGCVREAVTEHNAEAAIKEMMAVLTKALQR